MPEGARHLYSHLGLRNSLELARKVERLLLECYNRVMAMLPDIKYIMRRPSSEQIQALPQLMTDLISILDIKSKAAQFQMRSLYARDLVTSKRPGDPKLFRFHQA